MAELSSRMRYTVLSENVGCEPGKLPILQTRFASLFCQSELPVGIKGPVKPLLWQQLLHQLLNFKIPLLSKSFRVFHINEQIQIAKRVAS